MLFLKVFKVGDNFDSKVSRDMDTISSRSYLNQALNSSQLFQCVPYCPRLICDVGNITKKMFPFDATVLDVSPNLPRRRVADCYDHLENKLGLGTFSGNFRLNCLFPA